MPTCRTERRPIPYTKIHKMITAGKTHKEIAKAVGRFDEKAADPTKPIRAIVCRMKKHGYKDSKGKLVKMALGKSNRKKKAQPKPQAGEPTQPKESG